MEKSFHGKGGFDNLECHVQHELPHLGFLVAVGHDVSELEDEADGGAVDALLSCAAMFMGGPASCQPMRSELHQPRVAPTLARRYGAETG